MNTDDQGHFRVACASVSRRVFIQNLSYENNFDLHENKYIGEKHFHVNIFTRSFVLTRRQNTTATLRHKCYTTSQMLHYVTKLSTITAAD